MLPVTASFYPTGFRDEGFGMRCQKTAEAQPRRFLKIALQLDFNIYPSRQIEFH